MPASISMGCLGTFSLSFLFLMFLGGDCVLSNHFHYQSKEADQF